jgi:hypothetical protein
MLLIDHEWIKRVENGDVLVKGVPDEIVMSNYEDGWCVVRNFRESEEIEVERPGILVNLSSGVKLKTKFPYTYFVNNDWYILDRNELKLRGDI